VVSFVAEAASDEPVVGEVKARLKLTDARSADLSRGAQEALEDALHGYECLGRGIHHCRGGAVPDELAVCRRSLMTSASTATPGPLRRGSA
jgi:hypothetical protein